MLLLLPLLLLCSHMVFAPVLAFSTLAFSAPVAASFKGVQALLNPEPEPEPDGPERRAGWASGLWEPAGGTAARQRIFCEEMRSGEERERERERKGRRETKR